MGSETNLCGWHLPPIESAEASKVAATHPKIKSKHRDIMREVKYKTKEVETEKFRHFSDAGKYIDEYRKKHNSVDWEEYNESTNKGKDSKFSKYIDIRFPEEKICLTGLPQLRPPPKHVMRSRAIHEHFDGSPFLTAVPHLPHLTLSGAQKTVVQRELSRKEKKTHRKKTQTRLPYIKTSSRTMMS